MKKIFVGIDVSKNYFNTCFINEKGEKIFEEKFQMNIDGFNTLINLLNRFDKESVVIGEESSGSYHLNLFNFLFNRGYKVYIINPLIISNYMKISLRKTKTDKKDAYTIAKFLKDFHETLNRNYTTYEDIKILVREREEISCEIAKTKNYIEKIINITFPELPNYTNIFNEKILNLLINYPSFDKIKNLSPSFIDEKFFRSGRGRRININSKKIIELAKNSIGSINEAKEFILSQKISYLLFLKKRIKELEEIIKRVCKSFYNEEIEIIKSIKGIGDIAALHFISEVGSIKRFANYKKLIAYSGLDPTIYQSGKYIGKSRISKRGNRHIRRVLFIMAQKVVRFNIYFREYFLKKRGEGNSYKKAIISVTHKLIRVIYSLLINKRLFDPTIAISHNSL